MFCLAMYEGYASKKKKNECEIACMSAHVLSGGGNLSTLRRELCHQISEAHFTSFLPFSHKHIY